MEKEHVIDFRYAPPSRWTNIGLKDDFYKTEVREDGALMYGFHSDAISGWHFARVYEFGIAAARGAVQVEQVTESPRFACVVTTLRYAKADLTLKAFAHARDGRRVDLVLWNIRVHEDVDQYLVGLTLNAYALNKLFMGRSAAPARAIFAVDPAKMPSFDWWATTNTYLEEDPTWPAPGELAFLSAPHPLIGAHAAGFRPNSALQTEPVVLRGGESLSGALAFPQEDAGEFAFDLAWAEQAYAAARQYWENLPLFQLPFQVPDPAVMDMLAACARNILQAREIKEGLPVFQVGPTCYRGLWVTDGHFLLEAGHYMGLRDEAYSGVDALLKRVKPDGSIAEMVFHTKETAVSILTLIRQTELMGDEDRLRQLWPVICNAVAYIEGLRREAYALPADDPSYRLLPTSFADGGLGGKRGEYTTALWMLVGLKAAADAAARYGSPEDARRFREDFESLLADFREHAARDMARLPDGTPYLPICKPGSGEHVYKPNYPKEVPEYLRINPASATWALCHAITPGEVFSADDPLVQNLLQLYDLVDDEEGVPAYTGWIPYRSLWNYNAAFAAQAWLYAGRGDKAVDYLYAFANHATPTRVWREEQSLTADETGQLVGDMPHNWASAEFIRLARHLAVFERGDSLELLGGVPADWRKPGDVLVFEGTPTRFGPVDLRLETLAGGRFRLDFALDPAWKFKPERVRALLPAAQLTINGAPVAQAASGWVTLPGLARARVEGVWKS